MNLLLEILLRCIGVCLLASIIYSLAGWVSLCFGWIPLTLYVCIKVAGILYLSGLVINLLRKA